MPIRPLTLEPIHILPTLEGGSQGFKHHLITQVGITYPWHSLSRRHDNRASFSLCSELTPYRGELCQPHLLNQCLPFRNRLRVDDITQLSPEDRVERPHTSVHDVRGFCPCLTKRTSLQGGPSQLVNAVVHQFKLNNSLLVIIKFLPLLSPIRLCKLLIHILLPWVPIHEPSPSGIHSPFSSWLPHNLLIPQRLSIPRLWRHRHPPWTRR